MTQLSDDQIADVAYGAGFRNSGGKTYLTTAIAVCLAESGGRSDARNVEGNSPPSTDRGLWQINSYWHKEVTDAQAYDVVQNAAAAYRISGAGSSWKAWSTFANGAYKKYLPRAEAAANNTTSRGGAAGGQISGSTGASGGSDEDILYSVAPQIILPTNVTPAKDVATLEFLGVPLLTSIGASSTGGSVELTSSEIPQIEIRLVDQDWSIWSNLPGVGAEMTWDGWKLEFAGPKRSSEGGIGFTHIILWPRGLVLMRAIHGMTRTNLTPGQYITAEAARWGVSVINYEAHGQSVVRSSIGPNDNQNGGLSPADLAAGLINPGSSTSGTTNQKTEMQWDTFKRLASEDGCWLFADPEGPLVYGKPTILARARPRIDVGFRGSVNNDGALDFTDASLDAFADSSAVIGQTGTVYLPRWRGEKVRAGFGISIPKLPRFFEPIYIVTRVRWELDDLNSDVSLDFDKPVNPAETKSADAALVDPAVQGAGGSSIGNIPTGTKNATDFVSFALKQVGDKYVYGATPSASQADPNQFDCSSLVQWAAAQCGIKLPRTSSAQNDVCRSITIDEASKIRGALIFRRPGTEGKGDTGHVVISLGDGRSTVEARGTAYGVVQYKIQERDFNAAGMIPGMNYGAAGSPMMAKIVQPANPQAYSNGYTVQLNNGVPIIVPNF